MSRRRLMAVEKAERAREEYKNAHVYVEGERVYRDAKRTKAKKLKEQAEVEKRKREWRRNNKEELKLIKDTSKRDARGVLTKIEKSRKKKQQRLRDKERGGKILKSHKARMSVAGTKQQL